MEGSCSSPSLPGGNVSFVMTSPRCGRLSQYVVITLSHSGSLNRFFSRTNALSCGSTYFENDMWMDMSSANVLAAAGGANKRSKQSLSCDPTLVC